jgi:hypothetical protein
MRMSRRGTRRALGVSIAVLCAAATLPGHAGAVAFRAPEPPDWTSRLIDSAGQADAYSYTFTGIDIGPLGRAVMLYANGPNKQNGFDLRLARGPLDSGRFHTESIDPDERRLAGEESLALGPKGRAYVSFTKGVFFDQGTLKYGVRSPDGWSIETADDQKSVGLTELALGRHHQPYIAYTKTVSLNPGFAYSLWLATKVQGVWTTTKVTDGLVWALDVALNTDGQPEIAYVYDTGLGTQNIAARIARFDGASWTFQDIGPVVDSGGIEFGIDLLIDADGHEDVVYPVFDPTPGMMYAHYDGAAWQSQLIAPGNVWQPSMAYDPDGGVHVTYYDAEPGRLQYASLTSGTWDVQTIADASSVHTRIGRLSSLAFGPDGRAHVAYYVGKEFRGTLLRYAVSTPVTAGKPTQFHTVAPARGGWTTEPGLRTTTE